MGGHEEADKVYVHLHQMASIGVIFTSTYHTKQLDEWPKSSASCSLVVNYSRLSACQGDTQTFEGDLSTRGHLTSLRNEPQPKHPRQLSASILAWIASQFMHAAIV